MSQLRGYTCKECLEIYFALREKSSGLCRSCGRKHLNEINKQLREKQGPYYELWKREFEAWKYAGSGTEKTIRPEG